MSVELSAYAPFSAEVAKGTGLDFFTIEGWVAAEGGPPGNPLNIGPGSDYGTEHGAAVATINLLQKGITGNPTIYHGILDAAGASYASEDKKIAAEAHTIAYSKWKGNDGLPRTKYEQNIDAGAARAIYDGVNPATTFTPGTNGGPGLQVNPVGGGSPGSGLTDGLGSGLSAIGDAFNAVRSFVSNPESWKKIGLGAGGFVLIVGGLFIIVNPRVG